jgi:hypothetical protein
MKYGLSILFILVSIFPCSSGLKFSCNTGLIYTKCYTTQYSKPIEVYVGYDPITVSNENNMNTSIWCEWTPFQYNFKFRNTFACTSAEHTQNIFEKPIIKYEADITKPFNDFSCTINKNYHSCVIGPTYNIF